MDKVLLTGATGFIGSHVLEALTGAGLPVAALVRPQAEWSGVRALKAEIRSGDVRDLARVSDAIRGCTSVIHTAGLVKDWGGEAAFQETNVAGTLNVLEACRHAGISNAIITGSISSYGEEDSSVVKDESCPYRSHYPYFLDSVFPSGMNRYRDSKARATQQAVAFARKHQLNLTVLEPVWVYGEREFGTGFYSYVQAVRRGLRYLPGSTRNPFHVVYAADLAKAYLLALQRKPAGVERIIVGNATAEPMHRVFDLFCTEAGLQPPRRLPKWSVYPCAFALELFHTLARSAQPPVLTRARVNMFYDSIQFSTEKARRLLGFACDYPLEEGIRRTVAWYRTNRYL
jgi:nucleoside-diphosphate-sugar epimerase